MAKKPPTRRHLPRNLRIIFEDDDLIVIDKPAGLLTVGTATNKEKTAYYCLTDYVRKGSHRSRNRVFVVHRLDQWTSGVLIFAKSQTIKDRLQENWKRIEKKYLAIVHGHPEKKTDVLTSYLAENKAFVVYSTPDPKLGKLAQTAYTVVRETPKFSLLELTLLTGRKNQIRVHLADLGHPIVGDRKYGRPNDRHRRLALHAKSIRFKHPVTRQSLYFESSVPTDFNALIPDTADKKGSAPKRG